MQKIDIRSHLKNQNLFKEPGFINGKWVSSIDTFSVTNPASDELIATVSNLGTQDAELAIKAMLKGYRIGEVGIQTFPREFGKGSSTSFRNIFKTIKDILKIHKQIFSKNVFSICHAPSPSRWQVVHNPNC